MVDLARLIEPPDNFRGAFPNAGFRDVYELTTRGEQVLLTDPIYLADVYNSTEAAAAFLRATGVFLMDFGGDVQVPVWWQAPFLMLPTSNEMPDDDAPPAGVEVLAQGVYTDSGSFIFLPMTSALPPDVQQSVSEVLRDRSGVALNLPAGLWRFYYEQFPPPQANLAGLYRNVIARHEP